MTAVMELSWQVRWINVTSGDASEGETSEKKTTETNRRYNSFMLAHTHTGL